MGAPSFNESVVLCDFDGTIVNIDTAQKALELFADPSWRRIEEGFEKGEVSFEDSLRKEYALIAAPPEIIFRELDLIAAVRPHFEALIQCCKSNRIPLVVVSGGLDFYIQHFLSRGDWLSSISIHAPEARRTANGYDVTFPKRFEPSSINFKDDLVRFHKGRGERVFFIGDGIGDFPAAKESQHAFAIRDSKLAKLCRKTNVECKEIDDFQQVVDVLSKF
jgi:2-hydroxy-3-keto-5-methylthiopentenyl-1-phosphate phosphatase